MIIEKDMFLIAQPVINIYIKNSKIKCISSLLDHNPLNNLRLTIKRDLYQILKIKDKKRRRNFNNIGGISFFIQVFLESH